MWIWGIAPGAIESNDHQKWRNNLKQKKLPELNKRITLNINESWEAKLEGKKKKKKELRGKIVNMSNLEGVIYYVANTK